MHYRPLILRHSLHYYCWLDDTCTLLGVDYELLRYVTGDFMQHDAQRLYGSWDSNALRLTWSWTLDRDGDLFIYLDTIVDGAPSLYDPFGSGPVVGFPAGMLADYVVWIANGGTAQLLSWSR